MLNHYVYKITNLLNNKIYVGVRTHADPELDTYMGSGVIIQKLIKRLGKEKFKKEIISKFHTRKEADDYEDNILTEEFCNDPNTYNLANRQKHAPKNFRKDLWFDYYEEIREKYKNNKTLTELGKEYLCDHGTIKKVVNDIVRSLSEVQTLRFTKSYSGNRNNKIEEILPEIIKMYCEEKLGYSEIARKTGFKYGMILHRLNELGIKKHKRTEQYEKKIKTRLDDYIPKIIQLYLSGILPKQLAEEFKCNSSTITNILKRNKIPIRNMKEALELRKTKQISQYERERNKLI